LQVAFWFTGQFYSGRRMISLSSPNCAVLFVSSPLEDLPPSALRFLVWYPTSPQPFKGPKPFFSPVFVIDFPRLSSLSYPIPLRQTFVVFPFFNENTGSLVASFVVCATVAKNCSHLFVLPPTVSPPMPFYVLLLYDFISFALFLCGWKRRFGFHRFPLVFQFLLCPFF